MRVDRPATVVTFLKSPVFGTVQFGWVSLVYPPKLNGTFRWPDLTAGSTAFEMCLNL